MDIRRSIQIEPTRAWDETFVFLSTFSLLCSLTLLPFEFEHYRRLLHLPHDVSLKSVIILGLLGKTLAVLVLGLAPALVLAWRGWGRVARAVGVGWTVGVMIFLILDLQLQAVTGNHLMHFMLFLSEPNWWWWAGKPLDVEKAFVYRCLVTVLAGLSILGISNLTAQAVARARRSGGARHMVRILGGIWLLLVLGPLVVQRAAPFPLSLFQMSDAAPWTWHIGFRNSHDLLAGIQRRAENLYRQHFRQLHTTTDSSLSLLREHPKHKPNIIVIVIESFRYDALTPEVMPNLWRLAERGARMKTHYAASNSSHYGLFALLYGRSPLNYFSDLDAGLPPTLPFLLSQFGYGTHYLTGSDIRWQQMERYLGSEYFEVKSFVEGLNWERDRRILAASRALLESKKEPLFVFMYLMSTHFNYTFPPEGLVFRPSAPPPTALDSDLSRDRTALHNRYRNSAHYLDSLLGDWLEVLDLDQSLVIVTGDHGESLFDDGTLAHSSRLSAIQTRVPMVMAGPGIPAGLVVERPTSHIDAVPTLLGLLGLPRSSLNILPGFDLMEPHSIGPSYVALVHAKGSENPEDEIALTSGARSYLFRLLRDRSKLLFLGKLGDNGLPVMEPLTDEDGQSFMTWLEDHFYRSTLQNLRRENPDR